jgi:hypothetical protein
MAATSVLLNNFRSNPPDAIEAEFEHAVARLDYLASDRFDGDVAPARGPVVALYHSISLAEALKRIEQDGHLHPV